MVLDKHGVQEQLVPELFMGIITIIWKSMVIYITGMQLLILKDFAQEDGMCQVIQNGQL